MISALACSYDLPTSFRILKPLRDPGQWNQEHAMTFFSYRHQHRRISHAAWLPDRGSRSVTTER